VLKTVSEARIFFSLSKEYNIGKDTAVPYGVVERANHDIRGNKTTNESNQSIEENNKRDINHQINQTNKTKPITTYIHHLLCSFYSYRRLLLYDDCRRSSSFIIHHHSPLLLFQANFIIY